MVKQAKTEKVSRGGLLPLMGLVLAVAFGAISFFAGPLIVELIVNYMGEPDFNDRIGGEENRQLLEVAFGVLVFFTLFGLSMLLVSAAIGEDPDAEERIIAPRLGDKKATKKYFKELDKLEKKRKRQAGKKQNKDNR